MSRDEENTYAMSAIDSEKTAPEGHDGGGPDAARVPLLDPVASLEPFRLSDAEWITLFPPLIPGKQSREPRGVERGAAGRVADPLTLPKMLEALEPTPGLTALLRLQILLMPISKNHRPFWDLVCFPMWGLMWYFLPPTGMFSTSSLIAATVAFGIQALVWDWSVMGFGLFPAMFRKKETVVEEPKLEAIGGEFEAHGFATLARWMNLVGFGGPHPRNDASETSILVRHMEGDDLCPCKRKECAGGIPKSASIVRPIFVVLQVVVSLITWYLIRSWTLLITLRATFWKVGWAAMMASVQLVAETTILFSNWVTIWYSQSNLVFLHLDLRLHNRAMALSLNNLVSRITDILESGDIEPLSDKEEYIELSSALSSVWTTRMHHSRGLRAALATTAGTEFFLLSLICLAVSGCVPAWILASAFHNVLYILKDMFETAVGNDEVEKIASLYRSAAADIRRALVRTPPAETVAALSMREGIRGHVDILESLAAERGNTARFFGFVVTFGSIRALLATSLTVLVALWSIMRGLGMRITIESVCPE